MNRQLMPGSLSSNQVSSPSAEVGVKCRSSIGSEDDDVTLPHALRSNHAPRSNEEEAAPRWHFPVGWHNNRNPSMKGLDEEGWMDIMVMQDQAENAGPHGYGSRAGWEP